MVNIIDMESLRRQIRKVKDAGADLVIVSLHFGNEYERRPSGYQKRVVDAVLSAGCDIILDSHPHVLQPIEVRFIPDGKIGAMQANITGANVVATNDAVPNATGRKAVIVWSMGNFISSQYDRHTDTGMIVMIKIKKRNSNTPPDYCRCCLSSTHVYRGSFNGKPRVYRVLDVGKYLEDGADEKPPGGKATLKRLQEAWMETTKLMEGHSTHVWQQ